MLDPKEEELLTRTLQVEEENNKLLKDLHSDMVWTRFFAFIKWAVIIGATVGTYYYTAPYIQKAIEAYQSVTNVSNLSK